MRVALLTTILGLALTSVGCQTMPDGASVAPPRPMPPREILAARRAAAATPIKRDTVLPPSFAQTLPDAGERRLLVPAEMLTVSEIVRPKAEVRGGPGVQFELADKVLVQGTAVLVFDKVGVWRKIVVMATSQTGWVHAQTLAEPKPSDVPMLVDPRRLPTVLAMREVEQVRSFPAQNPVKTKVPKGAMFRSLMYADAGTLVLLPETNSVMWISGKDVQ